VFPTFQDQFVPWWISARPEPLSSQGIPGKPAYGPCILGLPAVGNEPHFNRVRVKLNATLVQQLENLYGRVAIIRMDNAGLHIDLVGQGLEGRLHCTIHIVTFFLYACGITSSSR
jgi:hypothetical protein